MLGSTLGAVASSIVLWEATVSVFRKASCHPVCQTFYPDWEASRSGEVDMISVGVQLSASQAEVTLDHFKPCHVVIRNMELRHCVALGKKHLSVF